MLRVHTEVTSMGITPHRGTYATHAAVLTSFHSVMSLCLFSGSEVRQTISFPSSFWWWLLGSRPNGLLEEVILVTEGLNDTPASYKIQPQNK